MGKTRKSRKYKDLQTEVKRMWKKKVVPIVVGAFGVIPKNLKNHLDTIGMDRISIQVINYKKLYDLEDSEQQANIVDWWLASSK